MGEKEQRKSGRRVWLQRGGDSFVNRGYLLILTASLSNHDVSLLLVAHGPRYQPRNSPCLGDRHPKLATMIGSKYAILGGTRNMHEGSDYQASCKPDQTTRRGWLDGCRE